MRFQVKSFVTGHYWEKLGLACSIVCQLAVIVAH